ncbi:MAG: hypothetical protein AABN95_16205 [Acidobacteriota bacterium]
MGTNYYTVTNVCEHCKRHDHDKHIGKSSAGWTFSFRGYREDYDVSKIETFEQWKLELAHARIFDEYGKEITLTQFIALVDMKKGERFNHTTYCNTEHPDIDYNWLDPEGHSFTGREFS